MKKSIVPTFVIVVLVMVGMVGCEKESGDAVVLAKEHIAPALPIAETSNAQSAPTPDEQPRPIADDEITVDGVRDETRGARHKPRPTCVESRTMAGKSPND